MSRIGRCFGCRPTVQTVRSPEFSAAAVFEEKLEELRKEQEGHAIKLIRQRYAELGDVEDEVILKASKGKYPKLPPHEALFAMAHAGADSPQRRSPFCLSENPQYRGGGKKKRSKKRSKKKRSKKKRSKKRSKKN